MNPKIVSRIRLSHRQANESLSNRYEKTFLAVVQASMLDHGFEDLWPRFHGYYRSKRADLIFELVESIEHSVFDEERFDFPRAQLAALLKKYPYPDDFTGLNPRETAWRTFRTAERRCRHFNHLLRLRKNSPKGRDAHVFERMRHYIRYVIGEKPDLSLIYRDCSFGPGASIGVHGDATSFGRKMFASRWTSTPTAAPYFRSAISSDPLFWEFLIGADRGASNIDDLEKAINARTDYTSHNKIAFVPKTAKTERTIAVEPLLNSWVQKGVDIYLRRRLLRVGIDLRDQSRNRELARQGSLDTLDPYCTIDLSSASDTISIELCRQVLPPEWFGFLNCIRSPSYLMDGNVHKYEKFVSMGNGFCFPLETLLFAAICHAAGAQTGDFSVYGDDIIVRQSVSTETLRLLRICGFVPNPRKTFVRGPFRESCGADWYNGSDVRPATLDYRLDTLENVIKFHNITLRRSRTKCFFDRVRSILVDAVPPQSRECFVRPFVGPDDTAFEVEHDVFMGSRYSRFDKNLFAWSWYEIQRSSVEDRIHEVVKGTPLGATVLLMAALRGFASDKPFVYRRRTRTSVLLVSHGGASCTSTFR